MRLTDSISLITGAASGLGAACARLFAEAGAKVVAADVNQQAGRQLAEEMGDAVKFVEMDVTSSEQIETALDLAEQWGPLRTVVNCAGVISGQRVVGREAPHELDAFSRVISVNLVGSFNVLRLAAQRMSGLPPLEDGERGVVINTSSVAAFEGQIGQAAYSASKGGIASMTLPIARELARHGIRVVAIAPGVFETPMMEQVPDRIRESLEQQIPFPSRFGKPAEFAALARHIVENPMLNGSVLRLDGAARMQAT